MPPNDPFDTTRDRFAKQGVNPLARTSQLSQLARASASPTQGRQGDLATTLLNRAGQEFQPGQSVAEQQLKAGLSQGLRQQAALAAGGRNRNLGMRQAQQAGAQLTAQTNEASALARLQEERQNRQLNLQQQLAREAQAGNLIGQERAQDLQAQGLNIQRQLGAEGLLQGAMGQQLGVGDLLNRQELGRGQLDLAADQLEFQRDQARRQMLLQLIGAGSGAAGTLIAASDRNLKEDEADGSKDVRGVLDSLSPKRFRYIDEKPGSKRLGIMAQDLEKTPLGKAVVERTPVGLGFNVGQATGLALAGLADIHKRLKAVEKGK